MAIKRWVYLALVMLLAMPAAWAEQLPTVGRAARWYDPQAMESLPGYQMDEESGQWRAVALKAEAQLDALGRSGLGRACLMQLVYTGNARTGLIQPLLQFDVLGDALTCDAVSLLVDGVRYDLPVASERVSVGERKVDRLTAPLTQAGMELVQKLRTAQEVSLRFHGKRTYTTTIDLAYSGKDAKKKLEASARDLLEVPGAPDLRDYRLWDLSGGAWKTAHDFAPRMDQAPYEGKLSEMVSPGSSGSRVREMEKALIAAGLMSGSADGEFTTRTRDAIKRAQKLYGLVESGSGDRALQERLAAGLVPGAAPAPALSPQYELGGARLSLNRWWTAQAVSPSAPEDDDVDGYYSAGNGDNRLLVVEGVIENTGATALRPDWQMTGEVTVGGVSFPLTFLAERDGGTGFGGEVLPLGQTRLLAVAQIPPAADGPGELRVSLGGTALVFELA